MQSDGRITVGLVFGGTSAEHEVSLASAKSILKHIDFSKFNIELVGITKNGNWVHGQDAWWYLYRVADIYRLARGLSLPADIQGLRPSHPAEKLIYYSGFPSAKRFAGVDCWFPITHGTSGEDGALQGVLRWTGKPVVGCDVMTSALAFDKGMTKKIARAAGIAVANGIEVPASERIEKACTRVEFKFQDHQELIVKPACNGSSFGVSRVEDRKTLPRAIELARQFSPKVLIEEYIKHTELTVGIVGVGDDLIISPTGTWKSEPTETNGIYDYKGKYSNSARKLICPSGVSNEVETAARDMATRTYRALECQGFARVDLFLDEENGQLIMNEVNTLPAFSDTGGFARLMDGADLRYADLLSMLIHMAIAPSSVSELIKNQAPARPAAKPASSHPGAPAL